MAYQNDRITGIPAPLPKDYDRGFSFTDYQTINPGDPMPGSSLDNEFAGIEQALDETQARARLIQRDDGALANDSVGEDQLVADIVLQSELTAAVQSLENADDNLQTQVNARLLITDVVDGLSSTASQRALSANQGRILNNKIGLLAPSTDPEAKNKVTALSDITSLASLDTTALVDGQQFSAGSYLPDTSTGSALLRWRPDLPKSRHDGVLFFSLTVPMFTGTDTTDYRNGVGETDSGGSGVMELVQGEIIYGTTVIIPTHHATLQSALDRLIGSISPKNGAEVVLEIAAGHALTAGFRIDDCDASWIRIASVDATVTLAAGFTRVSNTDLGSDVPRTDRIGFLGVNSKMPVWDIFVNLAGVALSSGLEADYGSLLVVRPTKGTTNADNAGGAATNCRITTNSRLQGAQSVFTNGTGGNVGVTLSAQANLQTATLSGAGTGACLDVSRGSYVHAKDADVSGGGAEGIYARRSIVIAQGVDFSNCFLGVASDQGSRVVALDAVFDGCTGNGRYNNGSYLDVSGATKGGVPVVASDFTSSNRTGGAGTSAIDKFNVVHGGGLITNRAAPQAHSEYITSEDTLTTLFGSDVAVASLSYVTIVDITTGGARIASGLIYGNDAGMRITIDGVVVLNDQNKALGRTSDGAGMAITNIPALFANTSLKIEIYNPAGASLNYGYKIYRA